MAHWKEHAEDCEKMLGNRWDVVHHWLDEYAKIYWPSCIHRVHRHHKEGIEEARVKWGDEAAEAAEIHIRKDEGDVLSKEAIEQKYNVKWQTENELKKKAEKWSFYGPDKIDDKGSEFLTDETEKEK